jgi:hypothetical protein
MAMVNEILDSNNLSQNLAEATCTDGAPAMLGENSRFRLSSKRLI